MVMYFTYSEDVAEWLPLSRICCNCSWPTADSCRRPVPGWCGQPENPPVGASAKFRLANTYPSPVAPPRTPEVPVAALRQGFEAVAHDPAFERELIARQGVPYSHIGTAQGQAIFRALAEASPDVIRTLHQSTKGPN